MTKDVVVAVKSPKITGGWSEIASEVAGPAVTSSDCAGIPTPKSQTRKMLRNCDDINAKKIAFKTTENAPSLHFFMKYAEAACQFLVMEGAGQLPSLPIPNSGTGAQRRYQLPVSQTAAS